MSSDLFSASKEFLTLYRSGKDAAKRGDNQQAHDLFRQAIEVDPYHEQVWLWLASVVDTDEDRRVCFENVLELNPNHPAARRQIQLLDQKALDETMGRTNHTHRQRAWVPRIGIVILLAVVAAGAAFAFGLI